MRVYGLRQLLSTHLSMTNFRDQQKYVISFKSSVPFPKRLTSSKVSRHKWDKKLLFDFRITYTMLIT